MIDPRTIAALAELAVIATAGDVTGKRVQVTLQSGAVVSAVKVSWTRPDGRRVGIVTTDPAEASAAYNAALPRR